MSVIFSPLAFVRKDITSQTHHVPPVPMFTAMPVGTDRHWVLAGAWHCTWGPAANVADMLRFRAGNGDIAQSHYLIANVMQVAERHRVL